MSPNTKNLLFILVFILLVGALLFFIKSPELKKKIPNFLSFQKPASHSLKPVPSNQWYTPIITAFPTQPLYAFPLAFRLTTQGLGLSYPNVVATPNTVFASYNEDLTIGLDEAFLSSSLDKISDWSIQASIKSQKNNTLRFTLGQGVPFTTVTASIPNITIFCQDYMLIYPNNQEKPEGQENSQITSNSFVITVRNHNYLVVFPTGTTVNYIDGRIKSNSQKVFIALLDKRENYKNFLNIADTEIQTTLMGFRIENGSLLTTYTFETQDKPALIAVLPHQFDFLTEKPKVIGSYKTLRGDMKLIKSNSFTTKVALQTPPLTFAPFQKTPPALIEQIKADTTMILSQKPPGSQDYYLGIYFGKVATLIQLADMAGLTDEKKKLSNYLKPLFLQSLDYFSYDKTKTSLIATKSEFGNENLNDHHFHYGYYIRTAAILSHDDPAFLTKISPKVTEMVKDIASVDRAGTTYPFLRNFDIYEGHSWASGLPNFSDGNNQESSSEALNAWYGLYLWANFTNNQQLQNYSLYLYNTENTAISYYWFNKKDIYPAPYDHAIASIVWGGKVDFTTWFSNQTNMIYGIQLLPFTPASGYLQNFGTFDRFEKDFLTHGGSYSQDWGELMQMWKSLSAKPLQDDINRTSGFYDGTLKATYLYFLLRRG